MTAPPSPLPLTVALIRLSHHVLASLSEPNSSAERAGSPAHTMAFERKLAAWAIVRELAG